MLEWLEHHLYWWDDTPIVWKNNWPSWEGQKQRCSGPSLQLQPMPRHRKHRKFIRGHSTVLFKYHRKHWSTFDLEALSISKHPNGTRTRKDRLIGVVLMFYCYARTFVLFAPHSLCMCVTALIYNLMIHHYDERLWFFTFYALAI